MPFRHGSKAEITVNAVAITTFGTSADFSVDVDTADTTTFGSTWKSAIAGVPGAKLDITGDYDGTASTGPAAVFMACITGGVAVAVSHKPGGTLTGQRTNTFNAIVTNYTESSPVGGVITFKASLLVTGTVTSITQ
jgi:hypothetical protein